MDDRDAEELRKEYELSKDFRKHVGEVIKKNRQQKGIKREVLAKKLNVDPSSLSRYEHATIDLKTSQMAKASAICDFPIYEYTEKYRKDSMRSQASHVFLNVVHESFPQTHKRDPLKNKKDDNRPPKPVVVWDSDKQEWIMMDRGISPSIQREKPVIEDIQPEYADSMVLEYSYPELKGDKLELLMVIGHILKNCSIYKNKKYISKIRKLLKAAIDFITFSEDDERNHLVSAYIDAYKNR